MVVARNHNLTWQGVDELQQLLMFGYRIFIAIDLTPPSCFCKIWWVAVNKLIPGKGIGLQKAGSIHTEEFNIQICMTFFAPFLDDAAVDINTDIAFGWFFIAHNCTTTKMGFYIGVMFGHEVN